MEHKTLFQRLTMSMPELEQYYREQRQLQYEQGCQPKNIRLREQCYPIFRTFLTIDRLTRGQTITLLNPPPKEKKQTILACTHIAQNDLENIYEVWGRGCWWFVGDPDFMYRDVSGLFVYLNGVIFLDTDQKTDCHIAYLRALDLLKAGGSLMIYPEGARNGSENLPVTPLFSGTAKMAMETGAPIIPAAIEQYDKRFVINFGTELSPGNFQSQGELTEALRDALAGLKWAIWEREGVQSRKDVPSDYSTFFLRQFEKRLCPHDTLKSVERSRYHTKAELEQRDAFAHLNRLLPRRENAFLLRKQAF